MTNRKFTTTLTLSQDEIDGEIHSALEFNPVISLDEIQSEDDIPSSYQLMSWLIEQFLHVTGVIDEYGNLVDPDAFHSLTTINATGRPN